MTKGAAQPLDTSGLHVRAGEFVAGEAEELMDTDELVESACREIVDQAQMRRAVLVFTTGIRHAEHVADVLRRTAGAPVATVFGETASEERDRVLADFKAGKRKVAEFWIEMGGRFVHIRYFPVRSPQGEYLGTLEVVQDAAPIRALTGERRLLAEA